MGEAGRRKWPNLREDGHCRGRRAADERSGPQKKRTGGGPYRSSDPPLWKGMQAAFREEVRVRALCQTQSGSPRGGDAVFEKLPTAHSEADLDALLPWRIELGDPHNDAVPVPSH